VYREGVEPFEQTFEVGVCKTIAIRATLEGLEDAPPAEGSDPATPLPGAPPRRAQRGFYGLVTLDLLGLSKQPLNLEVGKAQSGGGFGAIGLRAGYRVSNPIAMDLMLSGGLLQVVGAPQQIDADTTITRDYSLRSIHFGPNLKLMTTGEKLRFVTTVGAGIVHHRLAIEATEATRAAEVRGVDPYFLLELALGFNYRQFLGEFGLIALIDGSTALQKGFKQQGPSDPNVTLTRDLGTTLPMVGIGLRGGFSQWRPGR
jgi:hypothetical protein